MTAWLAPRETGSLVARAVMETLPVYAVMLVLVAQGHAPPRLGYSALSGLLLVNALVARASLGLPVGIMAQRVPLLAASAAGLLAWLHWLIAPGTPWSDTWTNVTTPWASGAPISGISVFWAWAAGIFVCVRGLLIGVRTPPGGDADQWFSIGAIVLVLLFALLARAGISDADLPSDRLRSVTVGYFVIGLIVTAFDRRRGLFRREGLRPTHSLAFLSAVISPTAFVLGAAVAIVGGAATLRWLGTTLAQASSVVAHALWQILIWLAAGVRVCLQWLGEWGGTPGRAGPSATEGTSGMSDEWTEPWLRRRLPLLHMPSDALPVLLGILAVLLVGLFLAALFRKREREGREQWQEESSSLWSFALLGQQLRALLGGWASALESRLQTPLRLQPTAAEETGPRSMRVIYRALLRWAADRGRPRAQATTARELAAELSRANLAARPALEALTSYYESERYGARAASTAQLDHAEQLLQLVTSDESAR